MSGFIKIESRTPVSYAGIIQIRFEGCNLSPENWDTPMAGIIYYCAAAQARIVLRVNGD